MQGEVGEADTESGQLPAKLFRPLLFMLQTLLWIALDRVGGVRDRGWGLAGVCLSASLSLAEERKSALNREVCQNSVSKIMLPWSDILFYAYICNFGNTNSSFTPQLVQWQLSQFMALNGRNTPKFLLIIFPQGPRDLVKYTGLPNYLINYFYLFFLRNGNSLHRT